MEKLLTIPEASEILNLSIHTIRAYASKRKLPIIKLGRTIRFKESELQRYIDERMEKEQ